MLGDSGAAFLVRHAVVEYLPGQATEAMRDCADGLGVPEADDETSIDELEDAAFWPLPRRWQLD